MINKISPNTNKEIVQGLIKTHKTCISKTNSYSMSKNIKTNGYPQ